MVWAKYSLFKYLDPLTPFDRCHMLTSGTLEGVGRSSSSRGCLILVTQFTTLGSKVPNSRVRRFTY